MENSRLSTKPTLARRVSDLFKDSNRSGSQLLFTNSSMQKLRHCCQNLNLFPYLLYSLVDAKATQKLTINQLLSKLTDLLFGLYLHIRLTVRSKLHLDVTSKSKSGKAIEKVLQFRIETREEQRPKQTSILLILAVYLAPFVLGFQLAGILSLIAFGKYTPGFVFLISALVFLGYIFMKVLAHDTVAQEYKNREKRKVD